MARILIATFGLTASNQHLMPWRTLIEAARGSTQIGDSVTLVSIGPRSPLRRTAFGATVISLPRGPVREMRTALLKLLGDREFDAVYLPVSWSHNRLMRVLLQGLGRRRFAYLPGSVFEFPQLWKLIWRMPFRRLMPYLRQAMFPNSLLARSLRLLLLDAVITNSDYSRRALLPISPVPVIAITPGRDPVPEVRPEAGDPPACLLYMGPPLAIRGFHLLLDAYLSIANRPDVPPLICLCRSDAHLNISDIRRRTERRWRHEKLIFHWSSLPPSTLGTYMSAAIAVTLPFLVVPSEIPLAIFEAAGLGKPVITTGPGGSGDFVRPFGKVVPPGDRRALSQALLEISAEAAKPGGGWSCAPANAALLAFDRLGTWHDVALRWRAIAEGDISELRH